MEAGLADGSLHPNEQKRRMAREVVDLYHGAGAGAEAEARFDRVHQEHAVPDDVPEAAIPADADPRREGLAPAAPRGDGLGRLQRGGPPAVEQGGVRLDGEAVEDPDAELAREELAGRVLQVGRRRFVRLLEAGSPAGSAQARAARNEIP